MSKRPKTKKYARPLINGRPALSPEDVQPWFGGASYIVELPATIELVQKLNHCALLSDVWKNASAFNNPSALRMIRIGEALRTLQSDLPAVIDDTLKIYPDRQGNRLTAATAVLDAANVLAPVFQNYQRRGRGREPERWHNIARKLGPVIIEIFEESTGRRFGFGKPTSPAVAIMQSAIAYLGLNTSPEAIVDAMRPKRARSKKSGGEITAKNP